MTDGHSVRELLLLAQNHIPPSQIALRDNIERWLASHPASGDLRAQNAELVAALEKITALADTSPIDVMEAILIADSALAAGHP